jgi:hypothetical protein
MRSEFMSRRGVLTMLGFTVLTLAAPAILPTPAEAQPALTVEPPTGTERRVDRRLNRTERRQDRRISRAERRATRREGRRERRATRREGRAIRRDVRQGLWSSRWATLHAMEVCMNKLIVAIACGSVLSAFVAHDADAQVRRGVRGVGPRGAIAVGPRGGVAVRRGYGPGYAYRRGYGWGPAAVGVGVLGAAALGAAAAAPYYGGYGADACLQQQQVVDQWGNYGWRTVRVC